MNNTPEQLRLAADIIEKGLSWEYSDHKGRTWEGGDHNIACLLAAGLSVRVKPTPEIKVTTPVDIACPPGGPKDEPLPVPDGWRELRDDEKCWQWVDGAMYLRKTENKWMHLSERGKELGAYAGDRDRIIVPIEVEEWVPLEAVDVPVGSVIRGEAEDSGWCALTSVSLTGVRTWRNYGGDKDAQTEKTWRAIMDWGWQISRDGGKTWHPCRKVKEAQP
jgi:hypothetical protein